jgi:tRNA uridine 5-carbamoylmethylation protein Kti12
MAIIYASKGLPGCGKTTAARKVIENDPAIVRANRDDIRFMMFGKYWGVDEDAVTFVQYSIIDAALRAGKDVYVDDTNLSPIAQENLLNAARAVEGTQIIWHDHTDVPLCVCIERDDGRERKVGPEVIRSMWERYLK